jgi:hypothetical protein
MRQLSVSLLFLAATFTFSQTPSNPPDVSKDLPVPRFTTGQVLAQVRRLSGNFGCPVGFTASRQAAGQIMSAGDAKEPGPTQALHLLLRHPNTPNIEAIEVTVYGTAQKGLYLPVDSQATTTVSKTFELRRISDSTTLSEADVRMQLIGTLNYADLISITYADGTSWHATANFQCRAVASNLILVGAK